MTATPEPAKKEELKTPVEETKPAEEKKHIEEKKPICLKDKWLIFIFDAWEKHHIPGFKLITIDLDEDIHGAEPISVYKYENTTEAEKLEEDWHLGRPIPIQDIHWLEDAERNFRRVVRRNRNQ